MQLAGGVLVARPVAVRDHEAALAPQPGDERIEIGRRVDERLHADVVALARLREQLLDRALRLELRLLPRCEDLVRLVLRRLDVGLVERVDLEVRAGDGDRELPAEELRPERVGIGQLRLGRLPVGALRRFAGRGDESLPVLAGRLRDELLRPEAKIAGRSADADLVAALLPPRAEPAPELVAGVALAGAARLTHLLRPLEQARGVDSHQHRRDDPERGERRVPAADRRLAGEDGPEAALARKALELRARIGDGAEQLRVLAGLLPEVVGVGARLERRAGLRGRDEERPLEVERLLERADRLRVRRVEDVEPVDREAAPQHLRGERRAAHPAQDDVVHLLLEVFCQADDAAEPLLDVERLVEPAEPVRLVAAGPRRRVALPDALDQTFAVHRYAVTASHFARTPSSSSVKESENFATPSCSSVATTSS